MMVKALAVPSPADQEAARRWLRESTARMHLPEPEWAAWYGQPEVQALEKAYRAAAGHEALGLGALRRPIVGADVT